MAGTRLDPGTNTGSVTEGLFGLKYERPKLNGNAMNLMSLAVLDLEVLFHLSYTETEVECLKTLAVESLTATDSLGMP